MKMMDLRESFKRIWLVIRSYPGAFRRFSCLIQYVTSDGVKAFGGRVKGRGAVSKSVIISVGG